MVQETRKSTTRGEDLFIPSCSLAYRDKHYPHIVGDFVETGKLEIVLRIGLRQGSFVENGSSLGLIPWVLEQSVRSLSGDGTDGSGRRGPEDGGRV